MQDQADQDFQLWIGVDGLDVAALEGTPDGRQVAWVAAAIGDTHAQVRQCALAQIVDRCDGVVMVACDDMLHPSRAAAAREALGTKDVAGCALRVVDEFGRDQQLALRPPVGTAPEEVLPRNNVFGMSNSAFTCNALRRCLPIPDEVVLVDGWRDPPPDHDGVPPGGYLVKGEINGCDVVGVRSDEPPVVVELKRTFGLGLVVQGIDRLAMTDAVYVAVGAWPTRQPETRRLCRRTPAHQPHTVTNVTAGYT